MSTAIVFGANGISGLATITELTSRPETEWKKIIAISRREPVFDHKDDRIVFKSVDLLGDKEKLASALTDAGAGEADHVFFYAYVAKPDEDELIEVNQVLFQNSLDAVAEASPKLKTFLLQTGYKYYGCHKGGHNLARYPWVESAARHPGGNFYFIQEDMLDEAAKKHKWRQIVARPNHVIGASKGNFMSLATTIALYAQAKKVLGEKFTFPGNAVQYNLPEAFSIVAANARAQIFLSTSDSAEGAYNLQSEKNVKWSDLWAQIAQYFDIEVEAPSGDKPKISDPPSEIISDHSADEWANKNKNKFGDVARQLGIDEKVFEYATWDFLDFATSRTWPDEGSIQKLRDAGWKEDTPVWDGFKVVFEELKKQGVIQK